MATWYLAALATLVFVSADVHELPPPLPHHAHLPPHMPTPRLGEGRILTLNASRRQTEVENFRILNSAGNSVSINVDSQTSLFVQSGQTATLYFEVTNNNNYNSFYYFYCSSTSNTVQSVQPFEAWVTGLGHITVRVTIRINSSSSTTDTVTFTAVTYTASGEDPTSVKAYLYVGQQVSDSDSPGMSYTINGDCADHSTPSTCAAANWGFTTTIRDDDSGLLSVQTVPSGFLYTTDFVAGTKLQVGGRYSASCCLNKVDLIATDLNGNQNKKSIDIYSVYLSPAAIAAIVLACILLVILLVLLCVAIALCIRRRRKTTWIRDT